MATYYAYPLDVVFALCDKVNFYNTVQCHFSFACKVIHIVTVCFEKYVQIFFQTPTTVDELHIYSIIYFYSKFCCFLLILSCTIYYAIYHNLVIYFAISYIRTTMHNKHTYQNLNIWWIMSLRVQVLTILTWSDYNSDMIVYAV